MSFDTLIAIAGLLVLVARLRPREVSESSKPLDFPLVSIVVPARNEERHITAILKSLSTLDGKPEIIVVDDSSTDQTFALATAFSEVKVLSAGSKPDGWVGKSWACWQGAKIANGEYLLFTDADTRHTPESLNRALEFMRARNADLISAPPFHLCENRFEKLLGVFHLLPLIAAPIVETADRNRIYAIGQYLLMRKESYMRLGGHEILRSSLTEDIDLAKKTIDSGMTYAVYPKPGLYQVQMYESFDEFCEGWKRLLRLGMRKVSIGAFIEIVLVFHLFFQFSLVTLAAVLFVASIQKRHGDFSIWGALFAFASLVLFAILSAVGALETFRNKKVVWHDRSYRTD